MHLVSENWPQPIAVDPAPFAVDTFACRFRDAVRAVSVHRQTHQALYLLVQSWNGDYAVSQRDGQVVIGPKEALRKGRKTKQVKPGLLLSGVATLADQSEIVGPDKAVIQAIAVLTAYGILSDARITGVTEEFIYSCLPDDYEGGVVENQDGTFTIY